MIPGTPSRTSKLAADSCPTAWKGSFSIRGIKRSVHRCSSVKDTSSAIGNVFTGIHLSIVPPCAPAGHTPNSIRHIPQTAVTVRFSSMPVQLHWMCQNMPFRFTSASPTGFPSQTMGYMFSKKSPLAAVYAARGFSFSCRSSQNLRQLHCLP